MVIRLAQLASRTYRWPPRNFEETRKKKSSLTTFSNWPEKARIDRLIVRGICAYFDVNTTVWQNLILNNLNIKYSEYYIFLCYRNNRKCMIMHIYRAQMSKTQVFTIRISNEIYNYEWRKNKLVNMFTFTFL